MLVLGSKALSLGLGRNSIYQVTFKSALFWPDSNFINFSFELLSFNAMVSNNPVYPHSFAMIFLKTRQVTVRRYNFFDLLLRFNEEHITNIIAGTAEPGTWGRGGLNSPALNSSQK